MSPTKERSSKVCVVAVTVACFILFNCQFRAVEGTETIVHYPLGDIRNCPTLSAQDDSIYLHAMDALPGTGYDVLRDIDMAPVLNYNYSLCRISNDGKYLLPDNFFTSPVKQSIIEEKAEYYDHWDQCGSLTSFSIGAHASVGFSFAKIQGSFSVEHSTMKSRMVNDDSSATRIHLRNKLYTVHAQPHAPLSSDFKSRLLELGAYVEKNLSSSDHLHYLAELLVRDYGTHFITSVKVGAIIGQTDFISNKYIEHMASKGTSVKISAGVSFFSKVSVGGGFGVTTKHTQDSGYVNNRTHSTTYTVGGLPYRPNMTIDQWADSISDNLVIIDRAGDPLHLAINSYTVPELRHETRAAVADTVYEAVKRYFKVNTHKGCTNPRSKNFDFQANVDAGNCDPETIPKNYTFGGAYQRCTAQDAEHVCNFVNQPNPLTHDYTCPSDGYLAVKFFTGKIKVGYKVLWIHKTHTYEYEAYWCVPLPHSDIPVESGFLFGGFYTTTTPNLLTNTMGCPPYFIPLKIGNYLNVCVSTEYELGFRHAIPFGGFETCQSGNPQATKSFSNDPSLWPHGCPQGYTQYFGAVEHGCEINLCIKSGSFSPTTYNGLLPPRLPPFHVHEPVELNDTELLSFVGSDGHEWTRNWFGEWSRADATSQCYDTASTTQEMHTVQTGSSVYTTPEQTTTKRRSHSETTTQSPDSRPLGKNGVSSTVAITLPTLLFSALITICVVAVVAFVVHRYYKRRKGYSNMQLTNDCVSDHDQNTAI